MSKLARPYRYRKRVQRQPREVQGSPGQQRVCRQPSLRRGVNNRHGKVLVGCGDVTPLEGSGKRESGADTSEFGVPCRIATPRSAYGGQQARSARVTEVWR